MGYGTSRPQARSPETSFCWEFVNPIVPVISRLFLVLYMAAIEGPGCGDTAFLLSASTQWPT